MTAVLQSVSLIESLSAALRAEIISGAIPPGAQLTEAWVTEHFAVARPTAKSGLDRLISDFHEDVLALYSDNDRAAGSIRGHDRSGAEALFPLMRCSIGVLELPGGLVIDDINRVGSEIAHVKAQAKESGDGLVFHLLGEAN